MVMVPFYYPPSWTMQECCGSDFFGNLESCDEAVCGPGIRRGISRAAS